MKSSTEGHLPFDGYIRVSRVNGRAGSSFLSPGTQRQTIERLATAHGLTLGEIIEEQDVSGKTEIDDRELGRLVRKIEAGESGGLIVWKVSRYSRNFLDGVLTAERIRNAGGRVIGEDVDTASPGSRGIMAFMLDRAEEELDQRRAGWKVATDTALADGVYIGPLPVGYEKGRTDALPGTPADRASKQLVKNAHAPAVETAFRIRANHGSWAEAARALEAGGVPTATGQTQWRITSVRSMIQNPIYKGELTNGHVHRFEDYLIVPPTVWAKAQGERNPDGKRTGRGDAGAWAVLGGIIFCAGCGYRMTPRRNTKDGVVYRYYCCQNTGKCKQRASINGDKIEALVTEAAFDYFEATFEQPTIGRDADGEVVGHLEMERDEAKRRFEAWEASSDPLDPGYAERKTALRESILIAERALTDEIDRHAVAVTPEQMRAAFDAADVAEKRRLVRGMLDSVKVYRPGHEPVAQDDLTVAILGERVEVAYKVLMSR